MTFCKDLHVGPQTDCTYLGLQILQWGISINFPNISRFPLNPKSNFLIILKWRKERKRWALTWPQSFEMVCLWGVQTDKHQQPSAQSEACLWYSNCH